MQAIILAAGMGRRLKKLTQDRTKCMVKVNGVALIERMLRQLDSLGLSRIVLVVGYERDDLIKFVNGLDVNTPIEYIVNEIYDKTNNIYSLYLAKHYLVAEDTLLLESDLIFEDSILNKLIDDQHPNLALVAKFENWMDGTVVTLDARNKIQRFITKNEFLYSEMSEYYKTVNIYKFSQKFSETHYVPFLEAYCKALGNNIYYEQVLKVIIMLKNADVYALKLENEHWYEIDDIQDLDIAESIFTDAHDRLTKMQKRYGGYWRYPAVLDFCYLVNPYFPNDKINAEIKSNFERLIVSYPSGLNVNRLLVSKYFDIDFKYITLGNGASELIHFAMQMIKGKVGIIYPTFQEYSNRTDKNNIIPFYPVNQNDDFKYTASDLINHYDMTDIGSIIIINPDNPSGNFMKKEELFNLMDWAFNKNIKVILDESFIDFSNTFTQESLLQDHILKKYPNLILIKSISKSFGVAGLRIGILASSDVEFIEKMNREMPIWNINSFAEFYLQIFEKYKGVYKASFNKFISTRKSFVSGLKEISYLRTIPTQANFVMCEITNTYTSRELVAKLLEKYNILIKDLNGKKGIGDKQFVRFAIMSKQENDILLMALKELE